MDAAGDVTVSAAGMKAGLGPGTAEEGAAGCAREITGAGGAAVEVRGTAALGTSCAAEEGRALPLRAKLTATDAPSTAAVTPAATSGRHTVRARRTGGAGLAGGRGLGAMCGPNAPRAASGSEPVADWLALAAASTSSAVGR